MSVSHQHLSGIVANHRQSCWWFHVWEGCRGRDQRLFLSTDRRQRWELSGDPCFIHSDHMTQEIQTHSRYFDSLSQTSHSALEDRWRPLVAPDLKMSPVTHFTMRKIHKKRSTEKVSAAFLGKWKIARTPCSSSGSISSSHSFLSSSHYSSSSSVSTGRLLGGRDALICCQRLGGQMMWEARPWSSPTDTWGEKQNTQKKCLKRPLGVW